MQVSRQGALKPPNFHYEYQESCKDRPILALLNDNIRSLNVLGLRSVIVMGYCHTVKFRNDVGLGVLYSGKFRKFSG